MVRARPPALLPFLFVRLVCPLKKKRLCCHNTPRHYAQCCRLQRYTVFGMFCTKLRAVLRGLSIDQLFQLLEALRVTIFRVEKSSRILLYGISSFCPLYCLFKMVSRKIIFCFSIKQGRRRKVQQTSLQEAFRSIPAARGKGYPVSRHDIRVADQDDLVPRNLPYSLAIMFLGKTLYNKV